MKILVHPSSIENIKDLENKNIDGIIIGLKNYSIFQSVKLDIDSIKLFKSKHKVFGHLCIYLVIITHATTGTKKA